MSVAPGRKWAGTADGDLLASAALGDSTAFAELATRYYVPAYRLAWRLCGNQTDAEDVAQEVFVKLWKDPAQVRQAAALKGWIMRAASNGAIDRLRRRKTASLDEAIEVSDAQPGAVAVLESNAASARVNSAMAALPERQRQALALVYYENLGNAEAAAIMETTVEAIESLLTRARKSLRDSLSGEWRDLLDGVTALGK
ncbi:MAG: sigma-70 family RNA polymerase sigma factor [Aestuariivirga sp.]